MPKVVTANDLRTGAVVYLGESGWSSVIGEATVFASADEADEGLARAQNDAVAAIIVDPFVTDFEDGDGQLKMTLRDTIRAYGPTIRFRPGEQNTGT